MSQNKGFSCFGCLLNLVMVLLVLLWTGLGIRWLVLNSAAMTPSEVSQAGADMVTPYSPAEAAAMVRESERDVREWKAETQAYLWPVTIGIVLVVVTKLSIRRSSKHGKSSDSDHRLW